MRGSCCDKRQSASSSLARISLRHQLPACSVPSWSGHSSSIRGRLRSRWQERAEARSQAFAQSASRGEPQEDRRPEGSFAVVTGWQGLPGVRGLRAGWRASWLPLRKRQNRFIASGMKNNDLVIWTAAPSPWRTIRRGATCLVLAALCGYGSWIVAQHVPAILSAMVKLPPIVRVEPPQERTVVHEQPQVVQPISSNPLLPRGPVIRTVTEIWKEAGVALSPVGSRLSWKRLIVYEITDWPEG